jgi:hypothetical protein
MIGIWSAYSNIFLYIVGIAMLLFYGLPLTFVPLVWGRAFGWKTEPSGHLTLMMARSLGVLIVVISAFALVVAVATPEVGPFFFDFMLCLMGLMAILHVYNAVRRQQPKLETYEIGLWVILFGLAVCFYPV